MERHQFEFYSDMITYLDGVDAFDKLRAGCKFTVSFRTDLYVLEWI